MALPIREFTPVISARGSLVHATCLERPSRTACGKKCDGWRIALSGLSCIECVLAMRLDCRPKKGMKAGVKTSTSAKSAARGPARSPRPRPTRRRARNGR